MVVLQAPFLRDKSYLANAASHFFIDILNSGRVLLVAVLAVSLGLTNAQVGLLLLLYNVGSSLSQPFFGWAADRFGARYLVVGGVGWTIFFYALAAVVPDWPALVAITLASLGIGAFHPGGTKVASQSSSERRTQATAFFFMAGQLGLFAGPILAGGALDLYGRGGYLLLSLVASFAFLGGWRYLVDNVRTERESADSPPRQTGSRRIPASLLRILPALAVIIIAYNTVSHAAQNFAPKLFTELGFSPSYVGWIAGLFMMGAAIGGVVGGGLADRFGGRPVIALSMLGAIAPIYFYIPAPDALRFPLLLLAGFFGGMPHSIVILMVQGLLPGKRAFASGLTLGAMFFSGALGSYVLGVIADHTALDLALQGTAVLPVLAAAAALLLPRGLIHGGD
jgi:FSR family fosmidomycin resistance protein-like MFS transporter